MNENPEKTTHFGYKTVAETESFVVSGLTEE